MTRNDPPQGDDINKRSLRLCLENLNARKSSSKLGSPLAKAIFNLLRQTDIIFSKDLEDLENSCIFARERRAKLLTLGKMSKLFCPRLTAALSGRNN